MNENVGAVKKKLEALEKAIEDSVPDGLMSKRHNRWHDPAVDKADLGYEVRSALAVLKQYDYDFAIAKEEAADLNVRIDHLINTLIPNLSNDPDRGVASFLATLHAIVDWFHATKNTPDPTEISTSLSKERRRLNSITARLNEVEPKTLGLEALVQRIEDAHRTAEELPADLELLSDSREQVRSLTASAMTDAGAISEHLKASTAMQKEMEAIAQESAQILARCQTTYSAATSVGLAAAFNERAAQLRWSIRGWVAGLLGALAIAAILGTYRLSATSELLAKGDAPGWMVLISVLMSMLTVGAPVWFAWLSTRQIGQSFRLAEDYSFKAAVSRAYEGYRSEAARIDKDLEAQLLASALTRLDEQPLRLVESDSPSTPLSEILRSATIREAAQKVPEFSTKVRG